MEAQNENLEPNVVCYTAAVGACKNETVDSAWLLAMSLLQSALRKQNNNLILFNSVSKACAEHGQWSTAQELLKLLRARGLKADDMSYKSSMDGLTKVSAWCDVLEHLQESLSS